CRGHCERRIILLNRAGSNRGERATCQIVNALDDVTRYASINPIQSLINRCSSDIGDSQENSVRIATTCANPV
ncbi:hypothetical protein, partial [Haloquadratum walsbyi]|uniref:hypothetical protein n=1 Tax=Haloquadratum walsbyi TaxID=293091 RepID=UPI001AD8A743